MPLMQILLDLIVVGVAGESFRPYAGNHQVDLERRRGHRCRAVAPERVWALSYPIANSCRHLKQTIVNAPLPCCYPGMGFGLARPIEAGSWSTRHKVSRPLR